MKNFVLAGSASSLLFLAACGGDSAKPEAPKLDNVPAAPQQPAPQASQAAAKKPTPPVKVDMAMVKAMFSTAPAAPAAPVPSTSERVALGKLLFHEKSLSKHGNLSCSSCHDLANYGQDGKPTSPGSGEGTLGTRNTPTVYNAFRQFVQFWDGRAASVEEQSTGPMMNAVEHVFANEGELVAKMKEKPELVAAFAKAFPDDKDAVSIANFKNAVGAFERTLTTKSKFDDFLGGNAAALSNEEKAGLNLFLNKGCITCHMGPMLGGAMYQKTGVYKPYPSTDTGRMEVTKSEADKNMFKVPMLLNVEKTAPYFHDGKSATLEDAVKVMADIQLNTQLKDEEVASIVTFLKTLTGPLPAEFAAKK